MSKAVDAGDALSELERSLMNLNKHVHETEWPRQYMGTWVPSDFGKLTKAPKNGQVEWVQPVSGPHAEAIGVMGLPMPDHVWTVQESSESPAGLGQLVKSTGYGTFTVTKEQMYRSRIEHQTVMPDPLDQVIDGEMLRDLVARDETNQRHDLPRYWTPAQRAAVSAHWSAQLRAKVEAKRKDDEAAATSVRYCEVEPWE